jgi:molybdate transport system permease protein
VLSSTVFLELSVGNIEAAVAVSLMMVAAAVFLLALIRLAGYSLRMELGSRR